MEVLFNESSVEDVEFEEKLLMYFFTDQLSKAAENATKLDTWLGAHLAEIMEKEQLIPSSPLTQYV